MCGILAAHGLENPVIDRARFIGLSKRLRHRGPDWSGCYVAKDAILCHERLAIVGVGAYQFSSQKQKARSNTCTDTGAQPLVSENGKLTLSVNGEIYNHLSLRASLGQGVKFKTHSDCEVILPLVRVSNARSVHPSAHYTSFTSTRNTIKMSLRFSMECLLSSC